MIYEGWIIWHMIVASSHLYQVPPAKYRARPWSPGVVVPVTGANLSLASTMASNMFSQLAVSPLEASWVQTLMESLVNVTSGRINGHVLSQLGVQFANVAT